MLTKNFYSYMRSALQKSPAAFVTNSGDIENMTLNNDKPPFKVMNIWAPDSISVGVCFGAGTTPAAVSDYVLESILGNTQISVSTPSSVTFSRGDTFDEYSVSFGVTNETSETITISEVGLITMPYNKYILVDRTVLDTPVTIPAHETKHIAYTIRFNYGA